MTVRSPMILIGYWHCCSWASLMRQLGRTLHDHPRLGLAAADLARSVESGTSMEEGFDITLLRLARYARDKLQMRARVVGVRTIRF